MEQFEIIQFIQIILFILFAMVEFKIPGGDIACNVKGF